MPPEIHGDGGDAMIEVRAKDRLFVLVVLPLALAGSYLGFVRTGLSERLEKLTMRERELVAEEDFPLELRRAEMRRDEARAELAAEKAMPPPVSRVKSTAGARLAEREAAAIAVLREAGLSVSKMEHVEGGEVTILRSTGLCPDPMVRGFSIDGGYPAVKRALEILVERELALAVQRLAMDENGRWRIEIIL